MHLFTLTSLLLLLWKCSIARTEQSKSSFAHFRFNTKVNPIHLDIDRAYFENYRIENCGANGVHMQEAFRKLKEIIGVVTGAMDSGSHPAFDALFNGVPHDQVKELLQGVASGDFVPPRANKSQSSYQYQQPAVYCATANGSQFQHLFDMCTSPRHTAFYESWTHYAVFCPSFFSKALYPVHSECYPIENTSTGQRLQTDYSSLVQTQTTILLHELVHAYIGGRHYRGKAGHEIYDINECMDFGPEISAINVASYDLYVASKQCSLQIFCFVTADRMIATYAHCQFPEPHARAPPTNPSQQCTNPSGDSSPQCAVSPEPAPSHRRPAPSHHRPDHGPDL